MQTSSVVALGSLAPYLCITAACFPDGKIAGPLQSFMGAASLVRDCVRGPLDLGEYGWLGIPPRARGHLDLSAYGTAGYSARPPRLGGAVI
ncbi:hypothetical protein DFH09DRAFT_1339788 [Mycena vulgaris]|nr:hypothetical protein DFH09DRAFT_1339788 [Mycena vulgaris]